MKFVVVSLLILLIRAGSAGLIVPWESFGYLPGEDALSGGLGGFATTSPATSANTDIVAGSLRYTDSAGNSLVTADNSALVDGADETATVSNIKPISLSAVAGNTLWLSFVGQQTAGTNARFFNLGLRGPDNTIQPPDSNNTSDEILAIGMPTASSAETSPTPPQQWRIWDRTTGGAGWNYSISNTPTTQVSFLLVKIELNAVDTRERYTLWVNPRLDLAPDPAEGFSFVSTDSDFAAWINITELRLGAGNSTTAPL
ncbi:MAG: hypothetical protein WCN98_18215, partial [Verrucomicrobiaceae bacterium]